MKDSMRATLHAVSKTDRIIEQVGFTPKKGLRLKSIHETGAPSRRRVLTDTIETDLPYGIGTSTIG
jgi:hypothetical protein